MLLRFLSMSRSHLTRSPCLVNVTATVAGAVSKLNVADSPGALIFMHKLEYSFLNMFRQGLIPSNFVRIRFVDIGLDLSTLDQIR